MTAVKRVTSTSDFLKMPFQERKCEVEEYEDCRTRNLLNLCKSHRTESECSSVQDCIEEHSARTFNCSLSCHGIYADVQWNNEEVLKETTKKGNGVELNREILVDILDEYKGRKARYVRNFVFKSDPDFPIFGRSIIFQYLLD